jgi:hypothetical protein
MGKYILGKKSPPLACYHPMDILDSVGQPRHSPPASNLQGGEVFTGLPYFLDVSLANMMRECKNAPKYSISLFIRP